MLTPQGPASYRCANLPVLENILVQNGYEGIPTTSAYETMRYRLARSIIIFYHNGTVLLQGADLDTPRRIFASLMQSTQAELPF